MRSANWRLAGFGVGIFALFVACITPALVDANEYKNPNGTWSEGVVPEDGAGHVLSHASLGVSATPITAAGTGTTAAVTATLAGVASKTTYICGFTITAGATAAVNGSATVSTLTGGVTFTYDQAVGVATAPIKTTETFSPCIPASAANTAILVTSAAAGTGGVTDVNAWGFQQ